MHSTESRFIGAGIAVCIMLIALPQTAFAQAVGVRTLPHGVYFPGEPVTVWIDVYGVLEDAVVRETPPAGWTVETIYGGGMLNGGAIEWNVSIDYTVKKLRYTVTPPEDQSGAATFAGFVNDGPIGGDSTIAPYSEPVCVREFASSACFHDTNLRVNLTISKDGGGVAAEETPPAGWTVGNVSDGGVFEDGMVRWELADVKGHRTVYYFVRPSAGAYGEGLFSGEADGFPIGGPDRIPVHQEPDPADYEGVTPLRIATVCMNAKTDVEANLAVFQSYMEKASAGGAHLIVFPETALQQNPGWGDASYIPSQEEMDYVEATAETIPGPSTDRVVQLAAEYGLFCIFGMTERSPGGKLHNTSVVAGPGGVAGSHRKIAVWGANYGGNEDWFWAPERNLGVVQTPLGKIGLLICMEMGSGYGSALTHCGNADFLVSVTIWSDESARSVAREANLWHVVSDQILPIGHLTHFGFGQSRIIHPSGKVMAGTGGKEGMAVYTTDILVPNANLPVKRPAAAEAWMLHR